MSGDTSADESRGYDGARSNRATVNRLKHSEHGSGNFIIRQDIRCQILRLLRENNSLDISCITAGIYTVPDLIEGGGIIGYRMSGISGCVSTINTDVPKPSHGTKDVINHRLSVINRWQKVFNDWQRVVNSRQKDFNDW